MTRTRATRGSRPGFTIIELLIVITIIGVLVTLVTVGVTGAISKANQARNQYEINQLQTSLESFKTKFGGYPPSRIRLRTEEASYDTTSQYEVDSRAFLRRMFPRMIWTAAAQKTWGSDGAHIDGGTLANPSTWYWDLEGDQCLVFFLGGIPIGNLDGTTPGCQGFATNPANPTDALATNRIGPFHEFNSSRLVLQHGANPLTTHNGFFSYLDTYGNSNGTGTARAGLPFAYFSAYNNSNGYNRYSTTDCGTLGVAPYAEGWTTTGGRFLKPNSFQIVSAGRNRVFGTGTVYSGDPLTSPIWTPANAGTLYPANSNGADDQSNFYDSPLGITK